MFEQWSWFVLTFIGFVLIGFLVYLLGNRKTREEEKKYETYTCGEDFPMVTVSTENFYDSLKKAVGVDVLRNYHSGKLSDYLLWIMIGTVVVIFSIIIWAFA